ncbi:MAG: low-specificity L-threonine aldolase [Bacillota bacterium]|nr:low-specificity L-threonine aldolase [Bacillota bacterium]
MIDLRSDTVTLPTEEMRKAMYMAEVGDDVYGEDPSVNRLQELAAEMLGKEDAMLVPSGTMGNQIAVLTHTRPGTEIILEADSHIYYYEAAAASVFAGVQPRPLAGKRGSLPAELVEWAIREDDIHLPPTSLICLENTHNRAGGTVVPLDDMKAVFEVAKKHSIPLHLDGARIFNASVASGVPAQEYAACTTSVQFCLSKGLGAPVGSIIAGTKEFIDQARHWRKRLGGGMRQAGVFAAAGIVALETMVDRLAEDHENARLLADSLAAMKGIEFNPDDVDTNIVIVKPTAMSIQELGRELGKRGILTVVIEPDRVRFTTNKDVNRSDIEKTIAAVKEILETA